MEQLAGTVVNNSELQKSILKYLPTDVGHRVVQKFPEFQSMTDIISYDLEWMSLYYNVSLLTVTLAERGSQRTWMWCFRNDYIERKLTIGYTIIKRERFTIFGLILKKFEGFMDYILPKITSTLNQVRVFGGFPTLQLTNKINTEELCITPLYSTESIKSDLRLVDLAALESVHIEERFDRQIENYDSYTGNYLDDTLLSSCNLRLTLESFNVGVLSNIVSKSAIATVRKPAPNFENLAELASNFVRRRNAGFVFELQVHEQDWDAHIDGIANIEGWSKKWLCKVPCISLGYNDVEICICKNKHEALKMYLTEKGTAIEKHEDIPGKRDCCCRFCLDMF